MEERDRPTDRRIQRYRETQRQRETERQTETEIQRYLRQRYRDREKAAENRQFGRQSETILSVDSSSGYLVKDGYWVQRDRSLKLQRQLHAVGEPFDSQAIVYCRNTSNFVPTDYGKHKSNNFLISRNPFKNRSISDNLHLRRLSLTTRE